MIRAVLFDVDGVLCIPPELFSIRYAKEKGIDLDEITSFFTGPFFQTTIGKADLKELVATHHHLWRWDRSVDEFLEYWFTSEHVVSEPIVAHVQKLRQQGIKCYVATNQEKYRAAYIQDVMFPGMFDGHFASHELGFAKPSKEYYTAIITNLQGNKVIAYPSELAFFDDSPKNIHSAKQHGIQAFLVRSASDVLDRQLR